MGKEITMTRFLWASRITLKVANVRVERLQSISEDDARAEAPPDVSLNMGEWPIIAEYDPVNAFGFLWDSINAKRGYGWDSNPWVWVVEFERDTEQD